jgi:hypothetical protein
MAWKRCFLAVLTTALLGAGFGRPAAAGVLEGNCRVADQPAATLLIPFFQVDLNDAQGMSTLVAINNASSRPVLARMVLWTNWGVPTLAFDIYLTGYDVQTLNLRDLLLGHLPVTGSTVSNRGLLSETGADFAGCTAPAQSVGTGGKAGPALNTAELAYLRAAHTGQPVVQASGTSPARCVSGGVRAGLATGYVTVDAVNRCSPTTVGTLENTPAHAPYFVKGGQGLASDNNVLWGDFFYVNRQESYAMSHSAVAIVADADFFSAGDYTFYGRYLGFDSRDDRAPLSSLYYARYLDGGTFSGGTELVVWRDNRNSRVAPYECTAGPDWAPLGELQMVAFDEEENPTEIRNSNAFPFATQLVRVGTPPLATPDTFGWLMMDLWHRDSTHAQGWVGVMMNAEGRYSISNAAIRADDLCNFGL